MTKQAWKLLSLTLGGSVVFWWFSWGVSNYVFGTPEDRHAGFIQACFVVALWLLIMIPVSSSALRTEGMWVITKRQAARAEDDLAAADAASRAWQEYQREKNFKRTVAQVKESLAELKELQEEHGELGTIAFIMGVPVEEVKKVAGPGDLKGE